MTKALGLLADGDAWDAEAAVAAAEAEARRSKCAAGAARVALAKAHSAEASAAAEAAAAERWQQMEDENAWLREQLRAATAAPPPRRERGGDSEASSDADEDAWDEETAARAQAEMMATFHATSQSQRAEWLGRAGVQPTHSQKAIRAVWWQLW